MTVIRNKIILMLMIILVHSLFTVRHVTCFVIRAALMSQTELRDFQTQKSGDVTMYSI